MPVNIQNVIFTANGVFLDNKLYLDNDPGTLGQALISQGPNSNVVWGDALGGGSMWVGGDVGANDEVFSSNDDVLIFAGSNGIFTTVSNNLITIAANTKLEANDLTNFSLSGQQQGDVLYVNASNNWINLPPGTAGQFLQTQGVGSNPTWATAAGGSFSFNITADVGSLDVINDSDTVNYLGANGIVTEVTDNQIQIDSVGANGILVTSAGINAANASAKVTVTSSGIDVDDSQLSIATSQLTGDVVLGTQTSGDYVASFTAGAGLTGDASGEGSTPTIQVGAGAGISTTADTVTVLGANGILVTAAGVNAFPASNRVTVTASGIDVDESQLSIATSQLTGDVALGTQTSGDYVASFTAGAGLTGDASGEGSTPTIDVGSANGIIVDSGSIQVDGANGILVTTAGVNVRAGNSTIFVDAGGVYVNTEAIPLGAPGDIESVTAGAGLTGGGVSGDVTLDVVAANGIIVDSDSVQVDGANGILVTSDGVNVRSNDSTVVVDSSGVSINDSTINITASQITDDIALGTDTSGDYVQGITGTANEITITGSGGEGSTPTVGISINPTLTGNVVVTGDLTVSGNTTVINSNNVLITDPLMELQHGLTGANPNDMGFIFERGSTGDNAVFIWDESEDKFTLGTTTADGNTASPISVTSGTLVADLEGSATDAGVLTTNYVATITAGAGLTGDVASVGSTPTIDVVGANGVIADTDSIQVDGANGILVTTDGVNVFAGDATISVTSSGVTVDESQLQIPTSSITSGDYVASFTAGAGLTGDASGTGSTPTIDVVAANSTIKVFNNSLAANIEAIIADVNHDNLTGFVPAEHVDHSTISISGGSGLTGGGTIDSNQTLNVGAANGIIVDTDSIQVDGANGILVTTDGVNVRSNDSTVVVDASGVSIDDSTIDHNALLNYDPDRHYDHTAINIDSGDGLTGGGDISSTRTLAVGAGNGVISDTNSIQVKAGNTILVTADGVNVPNNPYFEGNSYVRIASGSTGERPGSAEQGYLRYNFSDQKIEWYTSTGWTQPDTGGGEENQFAWNTFTPDSGGDVVADSKTDVATFAGANGIFTVGTPGTDTVSWNAQGANGILVTTDGINAANATAKITVTSAGIGVDESQLQIPTSSITSGDYVASFTAGAGLTGDASGTGSTPTIDVVAANSTIKVFNNSLAANIEAIIADVNHDNLTGFVPDEHVAHSGIDMVAGDGLTGGGTIDASRTFNVVGANGIISDTDSIQVDGANGILVTAAGVNVKAGNNTIFVDADGVYVNTANILTSSANYVAYGNTTSAVAKTLTAASSITFESNTAVIFQTYVISHGGTDASDQKAWILKGAIERLTSGATAFVDTPSKEVVGETSGASSWDVALAVNTTANTFLDINVTGAASANVDWYSSSFIYPTNGPLNVAGSILRFAEVGAGGSFTFSIAGDVGGPDTVENSETVTYAGANGIVTTISDNQVQFDVVAANTTIKTFAGSLAVNTAALELSTSQVLNGFLTYAAEVATNSTATLNEVLPVNSNTAPRTITTPSSPVAGNRFGVLDSRAKSAINNITVEFSASADNLNGASQDYILNENGASIIFRYLNADIGWVVENI